MDENDQLRDVETIEEPLKSEYRGPNFWIIIVGIVILLSGFGIYLLWGTIVTPDTDSIACTAEAKICPDGSSVGRTGPNCEFAECPSSAITEENVLDDWQTYRNEEFGYTIKHSYSPARSNVMNTPERSLNLLDLQIFSYEPTDYGIDVYSVGVWDISQYPSWLDWFNEEKKYSYRRDDQIIEDVLVSGILAKRVTSKKSLRTGIYIPRDLQVIEIEWPSYGGSDDPLHRRFDLFVSTFKFIDETDTSDWQTYRNEEFGFEFMYPPNLGIRFEENNYVALQQKPFIEIATEIPTLSITVDVNKDGIDIFKYYDGKPGRNIVGHSGGEYEGITIGGIPSYRFDPFITFAGETIFIIPKEEIFVRIRDEIFLTDEGEKTKSKILSTFKFIE